MYVSHIGLLMYMYLLLMVLLDPSTHTIIIFLLNISTKSCRIFVSKRRAYEQRTGCRAVALGALPQTSCGGLMCCVLCSVRGPGGDDHGRAGRVSSRPGEEEGEVCLRAGVCVLPGSPVHTDLRE